MKNRLEKLPRIVDSDRSGYVVKDGLRVEVAIYRLEDEEEWTLEVIDEGGTSTVWNESFPSDEAAWDAFLEAVDEDGIQSLVDPQRLN